MTKIKFSFINKKSPLKLNIIILFMIIGLSMANTNCANAKENPKIKTSTAKSNPQVVLDTTYGKIFIELYKDKAPVTVANFLQYVNSYFYDGTIFHRVINNFMIQGGGFTKGMKEKETKPPIKNEAGNGLSNLRGTIAMARTQVVDSATSQFFINVVDNTYLDHKDNTPNGFGYCVFGRVIEGMNVVDKINNVNTHRVGYFEDVPVQDIVIKSAKQIK